MNTSNYKPYLYKLTHRSTGRIYIGSRSRNVAKRLTPQQDLGTTYLSSSKEVHRIIENEGPDAFQWEVLEEVNDTATLVEKEEALIQSYLDQGYQLGDTLINKILPSWGNVEYILNETEDARHTRKKNIGEAQKDTWKDPEVRRKRTEGVRNTYALMDKELLSIERKRRMEEMTEEQRQQWLANVTKANRDPDKNRRIQEKRAKTFQDPEVKRKHSESLRKAKASPEARERQAEAKRESSFKKNGWFHTPEGKFRTMDDAAKQLSIPLNTLRGRYHRHKNDEQPLYYYEGICPQVIYYTNYYERQHRL